MSVTSRRAVVLGLAGMLWAAGAAAQETPTMVPPKSKGNVAKLTTATKLVPATAAGGRVIIFRGLANVFSRGMDALAVRFIENGVQVMLVNHKIWKEVGDQIIAQYKSEKNVAPIIVIGHSLGADASLVMSNYLGLNKVPVRLIIAFDGVAQTHPIMNTVQEVVNYYKPNGYGQKVEVVPGFKGTIHNIDLSKRSEIDHLNIDKNPILHDEAFVKVFEALKLKVPAGALQAGKAAPAGKAAGGPAKAPATGTAKAPATASPAKAAPTTPATSPVVLPRPKPRVTG